jgi:hypothetical protein
MNKKLFITTIALALISPLMASAQQLSATTTVAASAGQATEAQLLTACAQTSIDIRDSAISSARMAYNNSMAVALDARKEAEKKAVALDDTDAKKDAIKVAVDAYKKDVTQAQDALTKARKDAWAQFETNTNACRDMSKEKQPADKKVGAEAKTELRTMQATFKAETKAAVEENKTETKSLRETFKEQLGALKAFFKIGVSADTTTNGN